MTYVRPPQLHDYAAASALEWIQSDGVGGISASSILGANTRKHHAVISADSGDGNRTVLVASLQEALLEGSRVHDLSTNAYFGAIHPQGYAALESFTDEPWPTWRYRFGGIALEKQLVLVNGEHTVVVSYTVTEAPGPVTLVVRPLLAFRDHNALRMERDGTPDNWCVTDEFVECTPFNGGQPLFIAHPNAKVETCVLWYRGFVYERDRESHLDCIEDLFHPGYLELTLPPGERRSLILSTPSPRSVTMADEYIERERERRQGRERRAMPASPAQAGRDVLFESFVSAAAAFVFERRDGGIAIAPGLPWGEAPIYHGLIAMPGLLLATGRYEAARGYLGCVANAWWGAQSPFLFEDEAVVGQMHPADVPLWLFVAAWRYWKAAGDDEFLAQTLLPVLEDIALYYLNGREVRYAHGCIEVGRDGGAGSPPIAPLGTNALWYNAQMTLAQLFEAVDKRGADDWRGKAAKTFETLNSAFACETRPGFADAVQQSPSWRDEAVHSSQILAIGLPYPAAEDPKPIAELVAENLATPFGLRTLSNLDSRYVGDGFDVKVLPKHWSGSIDPAWFGCYWDARKHAGGAPPSKDLFAVFEEELGRRGCGHISGAFAGDAPHEPCDYAASAAGLGEVMRIYAREILRRENVA